MQVPIKETLLNYFSYKYKIIIQEWEDKYAEAVEKYAAEITEWYKLHPEEVPPPAVKYKTPKPSEPSKPHPSGKPKRPLSAFNLWVNSKQSFLADTYSDLNGEELNKKIIELWNDLDSESKSVRSTIFMFSFFNVRKVIELFSYGLN